MTLGRVRITRRGRCDAGAPGKCSNRYSGDGSCLQHNTPRAVRCQSTGKNVPTATTAAAPSTGAGRCASRPRPFGLRRVTLQRCSMGHPARRKPRSLRLPPGQGQSARVQYEFRRPERGRRRRGQGPSAKSRSSCCSGLDLTGYHAFRHLRHGVASHGKDSGPHPVCDRS